MLILAATPIGNLADASARLLSTLEAAAVIAAEDTRVALRLLHALQISNRPRLIALHDHNEKERAAQLVITAASADVVLLSDAGTPTVSDPGYRVVAAAAAAGVPVTVIPGPSAVTTALAVAGLPTDRFSFEGFLPRKEGERRRAIAALAAEPRTMVFFEAPARLAAMLQDLATGFVGDRRGAVCRELTKLHEEVIRGTLTELQQWAQGGVRGEIVVVVAGAAKPTVALEVALTQVQKLVAVGAGLKAAAAEVSLLTGLSQRELYQAALAQRDPKP